MELSKKNNQRTEDYKTNRCTLKTIQVW